MVRWNSWDRGCIAFKAKKNLLSDSLQEVCPPPSTAPLKDSKRDDVTGLGTDWLLYDMKSGEGCFFPVSALPMSPKSWLPVTDAE